MERTLETINGHQYLVTRDEDNEIIEMIGADPPHIIPKRTLTKFGFRSLLTTTERLAIDNFETNTNLTEEQKQIMRTFRFDFQIAEDISLDDPTTVEGVNALEALGLIGTGRAAQVLANQPAPPPPTP